VALVALEVVAVMTIRPAALGQQTRVTLVKMVLPIRVVVALVEVPQQWVLEVLEPLLQV
jgi:hypothetical protein